MTFWKTKEFKALQDAWYKRLEGLGFQDAEKTVGGEVVLKQNSSNAYRGADPDLIELKEKYFNLLTEKVQDAEFRSEVDRLIMTWHAEGMLIKYICEELDDMGMWRARDTVRYTIRKYEMAWGIKAWTPRQLHKKVK